MSYTLGTGDDAGAYDTLTPAWVVEDGTLNDAASDTPTLTRPAVTAQTDFTCDLTLTAAGTGTNAADATSDQSTAPQRTFTVRNVAVVTTDTDSIYDLSGQDTTPSAPTGGTTTESHTPTGWSRTQPNPSETQAVYRAQRTRSFSDGTFTSATVWGTPSRQRNRLLAFSEIDQTGLDAEFVALIECGEDSTVSDAQIYATSARGGPDGSIEQGDVRLDGTTDITRLRLRTSSNRVQINDKRYARLPEPGDLFQYRRQWCRPDGLFSDGGRIGNVGRRRSVADQGWRVHAVDTDNDIPGAAQQPV